MLKVRDIANLLFGYYGHGILMNLKAYFDGSGKNDSSVLTVGGYFADVDLCERIESDWNSALIDNGIVNPDGNPGVFHLNTFGRPSCKYRTYEWSDEKRAAFLRRLGSTVNRKGNHIISFSLETAQYRQFLEQSPNAFIYGPEYFTACALAAFTCIELLLERDGAAAEHLAYVFEKGDREHEMHHAATEYESVHPEIRDRRSLSFQPKWTPLLQPADLIAGKTYEVVTCAQNDLGCLDNQRQLIPLSSLSEYYSNDGTTSALMEESADHDCYVANKLLFEKNDERVIAAVLKDPSILERRIRPKLLINKRR